MADEEKRNREGRRRELENLVIGKVGEVSSAVSAADHVGEVVCALHSLAVRLFPVDSPLLCASLDERYREQVLEAWIPGEAERDEWKDVFYRGPAFPAMAKILLYNVVSKWLACFSSSARVQVYDPFFVQGPPAEILQSLVPGLQQGGTNKDLDLNAVHSNVERLLVLCLLENEGVYRMVGEFGHAHTSDELVDELLKPEVFTFISMLAQLLASIPDKSKREASSKLSSHLFFQQIVGQLLLGAEERGMELCTKVDVVNQKIVDKTFFFVGEMFSRISRRGSADILLSEMIPKILSHVQSCLALNVNSIVHILESNPKSLFWLNIMEAVNDRYAMERLSEELLRQLATKNVSDVEAYWVLWILFHLAFKRQTALRSMFVDKFLLWKVFPVCCLRWILQFSVLECPPNMSTNVDGQRSEKTKCFLDTAQRLVNVWSKREFVQSAPMEQQAYITAAVGWCLERMSKQELETTKDVLNPILQGVSCRLESPIHLVRRMASSIALVFSKVVDPKNPLYLDDDCSETIDWEFGLTTQRKERVAASHINEINHDKLKTPKEKKYSAISKRKKDVKGQFADSNGNTKSSELSLGGSDESIDPIMLNGSESFCKEDGGDNESEDSESSSDSSLQPYDLSDDDMDLQKKFTQLGDISAALRKTGDPDSVERALDAAEKLVRASPDELRHNTGDLVSALVHVRCSDVSLEGEEDSAEEKRQKALVALLVTCPFESLNVITKLLYSPNVDVSQRILIIDVMTEAAQELADSKFIIANHQQRELISTVSDSHPWFIPSNSGPLGAGSWKEVSDSSSYLSWSHRYERELPYKPGQIKMGKPRRWSIKKAKDPPVESSKNRFPLYGGAFMLPVMQGFDKRRHGVDLLDRDFIVLGKLIYMLGICMKCMAMHPEASALAPALLDMLRSRHVSNHAEPFVRRSVLFAASCILVALHPSYVASVLIDGNQEISQGLEWIRTWALRVAESDPDTECSTMAMACLHSHAEMALQASRVLESANSFRAKTATLPSKMDDIIIPFSDIRYQV